MEAMSLQFLQVPQEGIRVVGGGGGVGGTFEPLAFFLFFFFFFNKKGGLKFLGLGVLEGLGPKVCASQ